MASTVATRTRLSSETLASLETSLDVLNDLHQNIAETGNREGAKIVGDFGAQKVHEMVDILSAVFDELADGEDLTREFPTQLVKLLTDQIAPGLKVVVDDFTALWDSVKVDVLSGDDGRNAVEAYRSGVSQRDGSAMGKLLDDLDLMLELLEQDSPNEEDCPFLGPNSGNIGGFLVEIVNLNPGEGGVAFFEVMPPR